MQIFNFFKIKLSLEATFSVKVKNWNFDELFKVRERERKGEGDKQVQSPGGRDGTWKLEMPSGKSHQPPTEKGKEEDFSEWKQHILESGGSHYIRKSSSSLQNALLTSFPKVGDAPPPHP